MGRLKQLPSRLPSLPSRLPATSAPQSEAERSRHRRDTQPWRKWYSTARWQKLRWSALARDLFTCRRCGRIEADTSQLVADHIVQHQGDETLFWDADNLQCLCKPCHDSVKQSEERRGLVDAAPERRGVMARPAWFRKTYVPLTVVCGPPGAGKSTYVARQASIGDMVVCFDRIASSMFGRPGAERPQSSLTPSQIADVLRKRNDMLGQLMRASARDQWRAAWLILSEPDPNDRRWWHEQTGADVIVIATPIDECLRRIGADDLAGDVRGEDARAFVHGWWRAYAPAECDRTIR